jgi:hypothetical protein
MDSTDTINADKVTVNASTTTATLSTAAILTKEPIPKVIHFCNKQIDDCTIRHAQAWLTLNPDYVLSINNDDMCRRTLRQLDPLLAEIFDWIQHGPIKADLWRLGVLYVHGGIYSDIDNQPLLPLCEWFNPAADLITCSSYWVGRYIFNPNFIACRSRDPFIGRCLQWYKDRYTRKVPYEYWTYSVMKCFTECLQLQNYDPMTAGGGMYHMHIPDPTINTKMVQIIQECSGHNHYDAHNNYQGLRVFNNRSNEWDYSTHSFKPK